MQMVATAHLAGLGPTTTERTPAARLPGWLLSDPGEIGRPWSVCRGCCVEGFWEGIHTQKACTARGASLELFAGLNAVTWTKSHSENIGTELNSIKDATAFQRYAATRCQTLPDQLSPMKNCNSYTLAWHTSSCKLRGHSSPQGTRDCHLVACPAVSSQ